MLRVGAPRAEIVRIGALLRELFANDSEGFHALFDPAAPRIGVGGVAPALAADLRRAGLVEGEDEVLRGLHRIRRIEDRFYLLELGDGPEYVQDVWPETDALLAFFAGAPAGRLADVGTGSGVLAIEAARAGHRVVATDLYDETLALARFNAIVNDVALDLRRGHLFEPLAGLTFDRIVTAPHYGHEADQLRLEVLRDGPAHLAAGGTLALATALEWQGDGPLAVEPLLAAGAARGVAARVTPIDGGTKRHWFARAVGDERVPSRHRFLVELTRVAPKNAAQTGAVRADTHMGAATVVVRRPAAEALAAEVHVPLARLAAAPRGATWTVTTAADVAALGALLADLHAPRFHFDAPLPAALLDACRYGARPCVAPRGQAAGAILDVDGGVRPCAHGAPIAAAGDSLAELRRTQEALAARAFARRGCRDCRALDSCSRCLFPVGFADELDYCEFVRAHVNDLSRLRRLVATLARLDAAPPLTPITVDRWPRRAFAAESGDFAIGDAWNQAEAWLVAHTAGHRLFWLRDGELWDAALSPDEALAGAALADGSAPPLPPERLEPAVARLAALLSS